MGKIKRLSSLISNQIAAGEVIENPAAILRELLDNSVDAGATTINITVYVKGTGKQKDLELLIEDNGEGMDKEDLTMAFERYATSKLQKAEELYNLQYLGFRGEGLASIASVSFLEVTSRTKEMEVGHMLVLHGSKTIRESSVSAKVGTSVRVSQIFHNLPVRKKFLKSTTTELALTKMEVVKHILAHKGVATTYKVFHGERQTDNFSVGASERLKEKLKHFFNSELINNLIPINIQTSFLSVQGYISSSLYKGKNRNNQFFMVNKRVVKNKTLEMAFNATYTNILAQKTYAACFIHLKFPEGFVDMNVHPTKKSIRFQDEGSVYGAFHNALKEALYSEVLGTQQRSLQPGAPIQSGSSDLESQSTEANGLPATAPEGNKPRFLSAKGGNPVPSTGTTPVWFAQNEPTGAFSETPNKATSVLLPSPGEGLGFEIIGQFARTYILFTNGSDLFVVDQHAADERFQFDRLQRTMASKERNETQCLLTPILLERSEMEIDEVMNSKSIFEGFGLDIERMGKTSLQVEHIPSFFPEGREKEFLEEWISVFLQNKHLGREVVFEKFLSTSACHLAIRGGDLLSKEQMKELIVHLYEGDYIHNCPHGRPFVKKFSKKEVEKFFERT